MRGGASGLREGQRSTTNRENLHHDVHMYRSIRHDLSHRIGGGEKLILRIFTECRGGEEEDRVLETNDDDVPL